MKDEVRHCAYRIKLQRIIAVLCGPRQAHNQNSEIRMNSSQKRSGREAAGQTPRLSRKTLEGMVEEATIDAYGESEQVVGFFTMIEEHLHVPFSTTVLGVEVIVKKIDMTEDDEIIAVCQHDKQRISILEVPLPSPQAEGAEWIAAYRYWRRGGR